MSYGPSTSYETIMDSRDDQPLVQDEFSVDLRMSRSTSDDISVYYPTVSRVHSEPVAFILPLADKNHSSDVHESSFKGFNINEEECDGRVEEDEMRIPSLSIRHEISEDLVSNRAIHPQPSIYTTNISMSEYSLSNLISQSDSQSHALSLAASSQSLRVIQTTSSTDSSSKSSTDSSRDSFDEYIYEEDEPESIFDFFRCGPSEIRHYEPITDDDDEEEDESYDSNESSTTKSNSTSDVDPDELVELRERITIHLDAIECSNISSSETGSHVMEAVDEKRNIANIGNSSLEDPKSKTMDEIVRKDLDDEKEKIFEDKSKEDSKEEKDDDDTDSYESCSEFDDYSSCSEQSDIILRLRFSDS